jgi:hypothetical protein
MISRSAFAKLVFSLGLGVFTSGTSFADEPDLQLERTISLGMVPGRPGLG